MVGRLVVKPPSQLLRNPGPRWGFAFLQQAERWIPWPIFRVAVGLGAWVAVAVMANQRRCSRAYLAAALGRAPRLTEIWGHFNAFARFLVIKLRVARGVPHRGRMDPAHAGEFEAFMALEQPAFFGTFHFGQSDLLGYLLASRFQRRVFMVRLQMGNATDTRLLGRLFGQWVSFIWVNKPENLLFAFKDAVASGASLALQCDRIDFAAKTEAFDFLGCRRTFPFTIYHLALLFDRPVLFCTGIPGATRDETVLQSSMAFRPDHALDRTSNLRRAREHFQGVLADLETLVRQHPMLWFNFLPLNPPAPPRADR
jgi:predicted LPLAT superfamily acyltransferase